MLKRVYISCELNAPLHTTKKNGIDTPMLWHVIPAGYLIIEAENNFPSYTEGLIFKLKGELSFYV